MLPHNFIDVAQKKPQFSVTSLLGIQIFSYIPWRYIFEKHMHWSLFNCKFFCKQPTRVLHHMLFWVNLLSCFRYSYVILNHEMKHRSIRVEVFCRLGVLKVSQNSCPGVFFNKVSGLKACNFIKRWPQRRCFPANFAKDFKNNFF